MVNFSTSKFQKFKTANNLNENGYLVTKVPFKWQNNGPGMFGFIFKYKLNTLKNPIKVSSCSITKL